MSNLVIDKPEKKTVVEWLNDIDYSVNYSYTPSQFALEFVNFIKLVNGTEGEENLTPVVHYKMLDNVAGKRSKTINLCHRGMAKSLSLETMVPTPKGNVSMRDLKEGDEIFSRTGKRTRILKKSEVFKKPMYRVVLEDGRELEVSEDHLNIVQKRRTGKNTRKGFNEYVLTTQELIDKGVVYTRKVSDRCPNGYESKWYIPTAGAVELVDTVLPLDAYTVGAILGDGSIDKVTGFTRFHTHVDDLSHFLSTLVGASEESVRTDKRREPTKRFSLKGIGKTVKNVVGVENVYGKRVPQEYLWAGYDDRLALLRGLMDTDGTCYNGSSSFCSVSEGLINDVEWLARSLGFETKTTKSNGYAKVYIYADVCPFLLPRKANRWVANKKGRVAIKSIEPMQLVESQCIMVADESKSFLAGDFFTTHNTTLLGEYLFLYIACYGELPGFGKVPLALYVSDSIENGVKNMRKNLEYRWENSDFLKQYVPKTRFTDVRWEFTNLAGQTLVVKGYGAKTGVRGAKEMGTRPVLAVLDDLLSDEDAKSPTVIENVEATIYKAVEHALLPSRKKVIWSGTPFNAKDPLYKAVESGGWWVNVYPVCEKFPVDEADFRGSWPDRFTYEFVKEQYDFAMANGRPDTFNQELMLRIMSDEERLITDDDIRYYNRDDLVRNKHFYHFYITTDFATSEKASADYSVISVWAYDSQGKWYWVDGICRRQNMDKNFEDLFYLVQKWEPKEVGIEVSGQQGGFVSLLQKEMRDRNILFNLASDSNGGKPGVRPNVQKFVRFNTIVPWFKAGLILFPEQLRNHPAMVEAYEELTLVARDGFKSKHDDFADTISMLSVMRAWKPSGLGIPKMEYNESDKIWGQESWDDDDDTYGTDSYIV